MCSCPFFGNFAAINIPKRTLTNQKMADNSSSKGTETRSGGRASRRQGQQPVVDGVYGRLPPQAVDIEKAVIGALLIDKDAFTVVSEMLRPETFYVPQHQKIYQAVQTLNLEEKPVDIMTVVEELKSEGTLEQAGGPAYLFQISNAVASSAHVEYHAKVLAQKYLARQLISYSSQIQTKAFDDGVDVDDLMQEAEGTLFELSQKNMRQDYTQIAPVVSQALDIIQKASAKAGGLTGIPTGYTKLDDITSGWQPSDLVIIAGRPAMGKTSFALSLAKNISVDYHEPIAFFSLEMNNVQLVNRLISNTCSIEGKKIMNGQLSDDEWTRLDNNLRKLQEAPIYVDDTPGLSVFELRTKARRLVREKGVKVLMIDYLQLMNASGMRFGNRQEEVSTISRSLKGLAKELDIPVIALSQLSRAVEQREGNEGKRPQLSDLRESGAIEQDADVVMFIYRDDYYNHDTDKKNISEIIVAKQRSGPIGTIELAWLPEYTRFANRDHRPRPDDQQ